MRYTGGADMTFTITLDSLLRTIPTFLLLLSLGIAEGFGQSLLIVPMLGTGSFPGGNWEFTRSKLGVSLGGTLILSA